MSQIIVYTHPTGGVSVVVPTGAVPIEQVLARDIPAGLDPDIIDDSALPEDLLFRKAWVKTGKVISEDLNASKEIAHEIRCQKRLEEFRPHDEIVALRIPGSTEDEAEVARAEIRSRYSVIQAEIDASTDITSLKTRVLSI